MISPNFVYFIGLVIVFVVVTKSLISASAWLAIPTAYYYTLGLEIRVALAVLIIAGIYSQLVVLYKGSRHEFESSKRLS